MIKSLNLPRELIYMGKGENGYEKYMADDPTGINHVLDELYGVVFNEASAVLSFDEPDIYFDCAYELAIRMRLQKYPHRYLKPIDVENAVRARVAELLGQESCPDKSDDCRLICWLGYAIIRLQGDNSEYLKDFADNLLEYLVDWQSCSTYHYTRDIDELLDEFIEKEGNIRNRNLNPQPMPVEELCARKDFQISFRKKLCELDLISLLKIYRDAQSQAKFHEFLVLNHVTNPDDYHLRARIEEGEFSGLSAGKADTYEEKFKVAMQEIELLRQQNKQLIEILTDLKEKYAPDDPPGNDFSEFKLHRFNFTDKDAQLMKENVGKDFTFSFTGKDIDEGFVLGLSTKLIGLFCDLGNMVVDPREIDDELYPGAKRLLEIFFDSKQFLEQFGDQDLSEYGKLLRNCDKLRKQHREEQEQEKNAQQQNMQLMQAGVADAKNVTIINGNKIERSYGTNYNLESGASVVADEGMPSKKLQAVLTMADGLGELSNKEIPFELEIQANSLDPNIQVTPVNPDNVYISSRPAKGGKR